jgi:fibronectin type 3 domain-containing protein
VPKRIVTLEALSRDGHLLLTWTVPKENVDKTPLTNLENFQILRSEGILAGDECRECGGAPKPIHEMKVDSEMGGKKVSLIVEDQEPRKVYTYQVVSFNKKGYASAASNPVTVYWDYPPSPPGRVRADRGDKKVDLSWEPVLGATGYDLYRKGDEEDTFPLNPLNRTPLADTKYTDLAVANDKKYIYSVRTVKRVLKTDVEGKGSLGVPVTPMKLIPPDTPAGLVAISLKQGIELNWRRNQEPDFFGYYVYRRKVGEGKYKRLTESPSTRETYLDRDVELGQEYDYAVSAIDNSPRRNESPFSEEVRVKHQY